MNDSFLEIKCDDCGEPLLVGHGEKINYRVVDLSGNNESDLCELPNHFSLKFLCSVCNKQDDPDQIRLISVVNSGLFSEPFCNICGKKEFVSLFLEMDLNGNFTHICENCRDEEDYE